MYFTESKEEAEAVLKRRGYSFEWKGDDLIFWWNLPALRKHDKTGNWCIGVEVVGFPYIDCIDIMMIGMSSKPDKLINQHPVPCDYHIARGQAKFQYTHVPPSKEA